MNTSSKAVALVDPSLTHDAGVKESSFTATERLPSSSRQEPTATRRQTKPPTRLARRWEIYWCVGFLALAVASAIIGSTRPRNEATVQIAGATALRLKPIEEVKLGDRVLGFNPLREQADDVEPDSATWKKILLQMRKDSGHALSIELLRPLEWVNATGARPSATVFIDLYEMGAVGDALVTSVEPCPKIASGSGTVVTGRFVHESNGNVVQMSLDGHDETISVTGNHPYWSVDRLDFIPAGELQPGERIDIEAGTAQIASVEPIDYTGFLYNIETTEHVYRVGSLGSLVHNACVFRKLTTKDDIFGGLSNRKNFEYVGNLRRRTNLDPPPNTPVIDRLNKSTAHGTSMKTMDLTADVAKDPIKFRGKVREYMEKMHAYSGGNTVNSRVHKITRDIPVLKGKRLELGVQGGMLNSTQKSILRQEARRAGRWSIPVELVVYEIF